MESPTYPDSLIRKILTTSKVIAMVGASSNEARPSFFVLKYLLERGFRVHPVNPGLAGKEIHGRTVYASLADIPEPIDMVDIFRAAEAAPGIVAEALALTPPPSVIWMQLGVISEEARALAEGAGLTVIMNRCPKIEYGRLSSEIGWMGVNSRTISAKRAPLLAKDKVQRMGLRETFSKDEG